MDVATYLVGGTPFQLRGLAWLALNDLGQVGSGTISDDGGGGGTASWVYGGTIPCRVDPVIGNETEAADRVSDRSTHQIMMPPNTQITTGSRFAVVGRGTYAITAVNDRTVEALRFVEAVLIS